MTMAVNRSPQAFLGHAHARGRSRSPLLELYMQSVFCEANKKIPSELLPPSAADCAWGVRLMERGSKREDEKLSTEAGQVQYSSESNHLQAGRQLARLILAVPGQCNVSETDRLVNAASRSWSQVIA